MNILRKKTKATLLIAIFMISMFTVAMPVSAATPTIDGVIGAIEYDGAMSFDIGSYKGYVTNDDMYMYVAYNYAIINAILSGFDVSKWEWAEIITYKAGMVPETVYISMVWKTPVSPPYATWLATVLDNNQDGLFTSPPTEPNEWVGWPTIPLTSLIEYKVDTATEMKIPLTALGLEPGDTIKMTLGLRIQSDPDFITLYPQGVNSEDPTTYADYTLSFEVMELAIEATVDIDPDTLNMKSNGQYITAYINLPDGYNSKEIDPDSVYLEGIPAEWSEIQDGVFMAKFDRQTLKGIIENLPDYADGKGKLVPIEVKAIGTLLDGTPFEGTDIIQVIRR